MNLWLTNLARTLVGLAILWLPLTSDLLQAGQRTAVSPTTFVSCGRVCSRSRISSIEVSFDAYALHFPQHTSHAPVAILTPATLDEQPEFGGEVPLGWLVLRDALHPPSRRTLHALGDHPTTALERRVERCRLTL